MFKSAFSKYLAAFIVITFVSFLMLSGIITSMINGYIIEDKENELTLTGHLVVHHIEENKTEDIGKYIDSGLLSDVIIPAINLDSQFNIMVTDEYGRILLSTVVEGAVKPDGTKVPVTDIHNGLGNVNMKLFTDAEDDVIIHRGTLGGLLPDTHVVFADDVVTNGEVRGYVITLASTSREDGLVAKTRRAVINSSIWVMIATVIAAYFITDRIIRPLRAMTDAAKSFAKGDFSARVVVYGEDEVSDLARAFNNMAESLDSLEKMRNSFLANISHDLRTPMTTIAGFIDGITSGAIPPEKHEYYLNIISAEVHRLSRLVSQILDVSRIESGERKFSFTDFDIAEMARIILISFEQKIEDKHLDVDFDAECDEMLVTADKDAIYQVLYNLCHNAIKFACDGGKFAIKLSYVSPKKVRVSVFDEGQSIASDDLKLIFDRFYKTDKSRGLDKSGVGLGLYISKTIMDAHGESIWAESVGDSSEFIFTLKEAPHKEKHKAPVLDAELE